MAAKIAAQIAINAATSNSACLTSDVMPRMVAIAPIGPTMIGIARGTKGDIRLGRGLASLAAIFSSVRRARWKQHETEAGQYDAADDTDHAKRYIEETEN